MKAGTVKKKIDATHQYTIRGVPKEVHLRLQQKAKRSHESVNQLILKELHVVALGQTSSGDFTDLSGKWTDDPEFEEILSAQRQIDPEMWKQP